MKESLKLHLKYFMFSSKTKIRANAWVPSCLVPWMQVLDWCWMRRHPNFGCAHLSSGAHDLSQHRSGLIEVRHLDCVSNLPVTFRVQPMF